MTPAQLCDVIRASVQDAVAAGEIEAGVPEAVPVRRAAHDLRQWSSAVALRLGDRRAPAVLADRLRRHPSIARVDIAGPGFLNITVDGAELAQVARTIVLGGRPVPLRPVADAEVGGVQFAHGRLCSLARQAAAHGVDRSAFVPGLLTDDTETRLLMALADQHHDLAVIARAVQDWYAATRLTPRGPDPVTDLHRTRLWLAEAARIVLADGLRALGLTAPEHI